MKTKAVKYLKLLLKIAISALALYLVFRKIDTRMLLSLIKSANGCWLFIATVLFVFSKVISSFRLNRFFKAIGLRLSEKYNLQLYWLGMYYNLFLPGGIGGDGYKVYVLGKRDDTNVKDLLWAVLLDRITGVLALFCLAVILAYFVPELTFLQMYLWTGIPLALLFFYFFIKILFGKFLRVYQATILQSFLVQVAQCLSAYFILKAIHIEDLYGQYIFVFLISSIVATIPFTIGGIGAREITFVYGAELLQLDMNASVGLSFLFFLITAMVSLAGSYYSFRKPHEQS